jgi:isoamylase
VRADLRGTFAGLASDEAIAHLRRLGVTAVELLPVHHHADEEFLHRRGLSNYWGYSTIGFFAPHAAYAAARHEGEQVREFKGMVKALHRAGIEVLLDVVYNHTAEGGREGPALSFRGIDNASYYRLEPTDPSRYRDVTGTGNSLDPAHPDVLRLIMDSLRYWVEDCHVDGFRFDLAPALGREVDAVDFGAAFFDLVHQDPTLAKVKLIAEPWDAAPGGFQLGRFPAPWAEWNGAYRDDVRDFWARRGSHAAFAGRLTGSRDLFAPARRPPTASVNYITSHDGFTLADLVSYERKHNEANLEDGADGGDDNRSWNMGVEGPSDDPGIVSLRSRQRRNFLATLLLSQGVPMLLAGDELGQTQAGNNNAWCQDNETSWLDWDGGDDARALVDFTRRLIRLRTSEPAFRRGRFLDQGASDSRLPELWWFRPDGRKLSQQDWQRESRCLGVFLNGDALGDGTAGGAPLAGNSFLVIVNADDPVRVKLPPARFGPAWALEISTADPEAPADVVGSGASIDLEPLSLVVLRRCERRLVPRRPARGTPRPPAGVRSYVEE